MISQSIEEFPVKLAEASIQHFLTHKEFLPAPSEVPEEFRQKAGVFVTLKKNGELRGCIGTVLPQTDSVALEIIQNAVSSATKDPRFSPVIPEELGTLSYSVDVLGKPESIHSLRELNTETYGVIVTYQGKQGLLLPRLEGISHPKLQVDIAKKKAGIAPWERVALERFIVKRYGSH